MSTILIRVSSFYTDIGVDQFTVSILSLGPSGWGLSDEHPIDLVSGRFRWRPTHRTVGISLRRDLVSILLS